MAGWLALAVWMLGNSNLSTAAAAPAVQEPVALRVRAYADKQVDPATLERAQAVADQLLASAGLVTSWWQCVPAQPCEPDPGLVPDIVVILSSKDRSNGHENCGMAAHGETEHEGTVIVSVPCVAGVVFRLSRRLATRGNPLLAMPRHDDLVGAAVAHEIGHLLDLGHGPRGLMRATLQAADVVALRRGQLGFSQQEAARMRVSVRSAQAARNARAIGERS